MVFGFNFLDSPIRGSIMSKAQKSKKETKKQPVLTAKEKKAAKKTKKEPHGLLGW